MGYLIQEGHFAGVDTLGTKTLYKAFRLDEQGGSFMSLGYTRPMERIGEVRASVQLHRKGWTTPGETVLKPSAAHLYRTRTHHILPGSPRMALRRLVRRARPPTFVEYFRPPGRSPL